MELNRNYALILGLAMFCFLVELPGDYGTIRDYGDPDYSIVACELVAFMNQFVWLVVFAWTSEYTQIFKSQNLLKKTNDLKLVLEGFLLYKALIVVFDSGFNRVLPLYVFGYGVPAIIVVITLITAVIRENSDSSVKYLHDDLCWLSSHYVWALTGPAVFVILFNTIILFMGLRVTWKVVHFQMIKLASLQANVDF